MRHRDGSWIEGGPYKAGRAAYGVWRGVRAAGGDESEGGAMEPGSNIADAELAAVARCVLRGNGDGGGEAVRGC